MIKLTFQIISILIFSAANRGRGSKFGDKLPSTVEGRVLAAFLSAGSTLLLTADLSPWRATGIAVWIMATMLLWCTSAWDKFWSEEIGSSLTHSRLYGLMQMTVRQLLILPCLLGTAYLSGHLDRSYYAAGALTLGLPYYFSGYEFPAAPIKVSEYAVGALIGLMIVLILS